eukprot:COSAG02_NODE_373_length_23594_cov_6.892190_11_plen_332_part_00
MIVSDIEVHEVDCLHHEWIRDTLDHYYESSVSSKLTHSSAAAASTRTSSLGRTILPHKPKGFSRKVTRVPLSLRMHAGLQKRFIFIAHTDTGLTGIGEAGSDESAVIEQYIGTNPFQWIGDKTSLGLGTAMYDLMGKAVGVPVWQLVGPQQRAYVPVGSWTVSAEPTHMAEAVQRYAAQGYTWMKYHLSPFQNVIDQVEAIAAVAPPGFKLHLDFTMEPLEGHTHLCERLAQCVHPMHAMHKSVPQLLPISSYDCAAAKNSNRAATAGVDDALCRYDCVGVFEDSFAPEDIFAYKELKARAGRPVVRPQFCLRNSGRFRKEMAGLLGLGHY